MSEHETHTAFDHLKADVANNVQTEERLAQIDKRSRWARPQVWAFAGAYAAVLVAVGFAYFAFRGDVNSGTLPPATGQTSVAPTTAPDGTVAPTTTPPVDATDGIIGLPQLGVGTVVVSNAEQVTALSGGTAYRFRDGVDMAVADGAGGLIVQRGSEIYRVEPGAPDDPEVALLDAAMLAEDLGPVTLRLEDLAVVNGTTQALVVVAGGEEEQRYEEVWLLDPETGATESVYRTGAYEGGIARASFAGDILLITRTAEGFTWFEFFDAAGIPIDVKNPKPDGAEFPVFVDQGVISPDGDTLVYLESDSPAPPEDGNWSIDLVVWNLANGAEDRRMEIELGNWLNGRMDFDGTGVVLGRIQFTGDGWTSGSALQIASLDADAGITTDTGAIGAPSIVKIGPAETTLGRLEGCGEFVNNRTGTCLSDDGATAAWISGCDADVFEAPADRSSMECRI